MSSKVSPHVHTVMYSDKASNRITLQRIQILCVTILTYENYNIKLMLKQLNLKKQNKFKK